MKKRFIKRKKLGMALIFTLMVSVLAVAIASSYIGMTASSAKAARAYSKEAVALSTAQMGLDAVLNAMGNHSNWTWNGTFSCNRLIDNVRLNIRANIANGVSNVVSNTAAGNTEATTPLATGLLLTHRDNVNLFGPTLGNNFLANINNASIPTLGNVYSTNNFRIRYGNEDKIANLIVAVVPENVSAGGLHKGNVNYAIGVTSIIRELNSNGAIDNSTTFASLLPNIVASRTLKMRVSNAYPGNAYQNVVAADYPNSGHADVPDFGYPNWEDLTADAAFLDENTVFDGGIRVDGASTSSNERWGAPQKTATFNNSNFSKSNYHSDSSGNMRTTKDSGLSDYLKSVYNSKGQFQPGYEEADTAGILKFSTLNKKFNKSGLDNYKYRTSTDTNKTRYLSEINKAASVNQKAVYYNLSDGTKVVNTDDKGWINEIASSNNSKFESGLKSTNIDSMWNFGDKPLMSAKDTSGTSGLYRQMTVEAGKKTGCFDFSISDYQPDPMYANDTIEAPTVRITVSQRNGDDYYTIQRVKYVADASKASGWSETLTDIGSCSYTQLKDSGVEGMIYVGGANVQVSGTVSKSISIVSDVNPSIEQANALSNEKYKNSGYNDNVDPTSGKFDARLTSPNVKSGSNYLYPDAKYNSSTGTWGLMSATNNAPKKTLISGEKNGFGTNTDFRFPTYGEDQQPSGNITIIGDLKNADGTNPAIGLIAKNRVMLNDMSHKTQNDVTRRPQHASNTTNPNVPGKEDTYDASMDNVLTVKATVASETHNMCFDFNNISKNLNYTNNSSNNSYVGNNYRKGAPGDYTGSASNPTAATPASFQDCKTNYGMIVDERLAAKLTDSRNDSTGANWNKNNALIADDGKTNGGRFFFYKYSYLSDPAKKSIWSDTYMGAIRPDGLPAGKQIYTNGALDFNGMIISRFGDINADAGEPGTDVRLNQLGYVNQFMTFDSNTLDNCPPWFSMTNQNLNSYDSIIKWNIISYVDKGSFNGNN